VRSHNATVYSWRRLYGSFGQPQGSFEPTRCFQRTKYGIMNATQLADPMEGERWVSEQDADLFDHIVNTCIMSLNNGDDKQLQQQQQQQQQQRKRTHVLHFDPRTPDYTINPKNEYPKITNHVVTGLLGHSLLIEQKRVALYCPNSGRSNKFAALIMPIDKAMALIFPNGKIVMTGKTTPESALFTLHAYRNTLGNVTQKVLVYEEAEKNDGVPAGTPPRLLGIYPCYLKTLLGFCNFRVVNTVGSGPVVRNVNETVSLASIAKDFPQMTNWKPEIFPGLKFKLPNGNPILPGGKKCTAHIFERRIVLMGPQPAENIEIAYSFFLQLIKNYIETNNELFDHGNRYVHRIKEMMWKLEVTKQQEKDIIRRLKAREQQQLQQQQQLAEMNSPVSISASGVEVIDVVPNVNVGKSSLFDFDTTVEAELPDELLSELNKWMNIQI